MRDVHNRIPKISPKYHVGPTCHPFLSAYLLPHSSSFSTPSPDPVPRPLPCSSAVPPGTLLRHCGHAPPLPALAVSPDPQTHLVALDTLAGSCRAPPTLQGLLLFPSLFRYDFIINQLESWRCGKIRLEFSQKPNDVLEVG